MLSDLKLAFRQLVKSPGFAITAVRHPGARHRRQRRRVQRAERPRAAAAERARRRNLFSVQRFHVTLAVLPRLYGSARPQPHLRQAWWLSNHRLWSAIDTGAIRTTAWPYPRQRQLLRRARRFSPISAASFTPPTKRARTAPLRRAQLRLLAQSTSTATAA